MTMAEPDELYLHPPSAMQYWLGHYILALDEGRSAARRPMPMLPHLKLELEEMRNDAPISAWVSASSR